MKNECSPQPSFGEFIRYRRILLGLSLEELALPCSLDKARLSRMERGDYPPPPLPQLKKMAKLLQIPDPSEEFSEMVRLAMEGRLSSSKLKGPKGKKLQVKVHGGLPTMVGMASPEVVRMKENPTKVYNLKEAATRALMNIQLDGAMVEKARLLVRDSKGRDWEYEVRLSARKGAGREENHG